VSDHLDLLYAVLDLQLVDCEDRRCGRVDDIELEEDGTVVALLSGYAAWPDRVPRRLAPFLARLLGRPNRERDVVRVPWEAVDRVGPYIHLRVKATDLGLGAGDDELRWLLGRLPWGHTRKAGEP
jgi:sporulation protein YlmC with PRC-barrel domain